MAADRLIIPSDENPPDKEMFFFVPAMHPDKRHHIIASTFAHYDDEFLFSCLMLFASDRFFFVIREERWYAAMACLHPVRDEPLPCCALCSHFNLGTLFRFCVNKIGGHSLRGSFVCFSDWGTILMNRVIDVRRAPSFSSFLQTASNV